MEGSQTISQVDFMKEFSIGNHNCWQQKSAQIPVDI